MIKLTNEITNDTFDISQPKQKLYRFTELTEESKKIASSEVYDEEVYKEQDYSIDVESTQDYLVELVREAGLDVVNNSIYWESNYGISLDLSEVNMNEEYIKKVLSDDDFKIYEALKEVSDSYMEGNLFDNNKKGFHLSFYASLYEGYESEAMEFIMNFSSDEDVKTKYKLALLFCNDDGGMDDDEGIEDLESDVQMLGEQLAERLSETISKPLEELYNKLYQVVKENDDYLGSEQYFRDLLEGECYLFEKYLFNKNGNIIVQDDVFLNDDDEDLFEPYKEATL